MMKFKQVVVWVLLVGTLGILGASAQDIPAQDVPVQHITKTLNREGGTVFPIGKYNAGYARYFTGKSYMSVLSTGGPTVVNITFDTNARTYWHIHHNTCQILIGESGCGYYQIWGQPAHELRPGETMTIPEGVKHWHGAAPGSMFQHVVIMENKPGVSVEWLEPVNEKDYKALK